MREVRQKKKVKLIRCKTPLQGFSITPPECCIFGRQCEYENRGFTG